KFDIVLNDSIRLIRLTQKTGAVLDFIDSVRDLVPNDWREIVESDCPTMFLDRRVERNDCMPATILSARQTDIAHYTDQPAPGNQSSKTVFPHLVQFRQKCFVVVYVAQLILYLSVFLKRP